MTFVAGTSLLKIDEWPTANPLVSSSSVEHQSVHSFAHALSTCIENIRLQLSKFPGFTPARTPINTSALFLSHEEFEDQLEAIASLCGRVGLFASCSHKADVCFSSSHSISNHRNTLPFPRNPKCYCLTFIPNCSPTSKEDRRPQFAQY